MTSLDEFIEAQRAKREADISNAQARQLGAIVDRLMSKAQEVYRIDTSHALNGRRL